MYVRINETRDQNGVVKINLLFSANRQLRTDVDDDAFDKGDIAMVDKRFGKDIEDAGISQHQIAFGLSECASNAVLQGGRRERGLVHGKEPHKRFFFGAFDANLKFGKLFCSAKASRASSMPGIV